MNLAEQRNWTIFLQRMAKQYSSFGATRTPKDIAQILQKEHVIYKLENEAELEKLIGKLLGEEHRQELLERLKPPPPISCSIDGCSGELKMQNRRLECTKGGWRHVLIAQIAAAHGLDAKKLLERHEQIRAEREKEQNVILEEWREGIRMPPVLKTLSE